MIAIAFIVGLFVGVGICWQFVIRARRLVASYAAAINVLTLRQEHADRMAGRFGGGQ